LEPRITRISCPVRINLRLLIDVVEKRKRGGAKRAVPMMMNNPMTNLRRGINVSFSIRWRGAATGSHDRRSK
jgi:hypothetical protein